MDQSMCIIAQINVYSYVELFSDPITNIISSKVLLMKY